VLDRSPRFHRCLVAAAALFVSVAVGAAFPVTAGAAKKKPKPVVNMSVGELAVFRVGNDPQTIPDDVRDKVMATIGTYVTAATVKPLQKGAVDDAALASTLAPAATARASGPDRATLVDEGLPKALGRIVVSAEPIKLTGLADAQGQVVVVTAALKTTTTAKTAKGSLLITRTGELVLSPDAGGWRIDGYDLAVERVGKGIAPTTPTAGAAAPAAAGAASK
jgi:hypothetical protein